MAHLIEEDCTCHVTHLLLCISGRNSHAQPLHVQQREYLGMKRWARSNLLRCRNKVCRLLMPKLHLVPQHEYVKELPNVFLPVVFCTRRETQRVLSHIQGAEHQPVQVEFQAPTCDCVPGRKLLPYFPKLLINPCLLLFLALTVPDVRYEHLQCGQSSSWIRQKT